MPGNYAALVAARLARDPRDMLAPVDLPKPARPEPRGTWSVVRTYDDTAKHDEPIRVNCTERDATRIAGELRDAMTDADCSKGFQILAKNKTKFRFPTQEQRSARAAIAGRKSWANRARKAR
jgi:hypothetical protein